MTTRNGSAEPAKRARAALTVKQTQVVLLLSRGYSHKEVATELGLNPTTVVRHLQAARRRTGARSTMHLVALVAAARERERVLKELALGVDTWLARGKIEDNGTASHDGAVPPGREARVATEESDAARLLRLFGRGGRETENGTGE